jgi:TolA-binding protein
MLRSMHAVALALPALVACAQTSQPPPTTTAPVVSASVSTSTSAPVASVAPEPAPVPAATGVGDQFRSCQSDADCLAVPRAGCCDNGWKEAVAASQTDAYAQANACTRKRPMCPMFKVRDRRVAYCEPQTHLCSMKQP